MFLTGGVQNVGDFRALAFGPGSVHGGTVAGDGVEDGEEREGGDGFFGEDVDFVGDGPGGEPRGGGEDRGFGDEGAAGEGVEEGLRAFFGGDVGGGSRG